MLAKPSAIPQIEHKMTSKNEVKRFGLLYGGSQSMALLYRQIERVTLTDATVLLEGESGTGKDCTDDSSVG
jgi:DNA-binding NtrC family response regulator